MDEQQEKQRIELRGASPEADHALPSVQPNTESDDTDETTTGHSDDSALHRLRAVKRCSIDWERMEGDECVRYCNQCKFKVFRLEDNKPELLEQLTLNAKIGRGGRVKAIYRRFDGTYMFDDCERERRNYLSGVLVIPPFLFGLMFFMAPGIFAPAFFGSPYGRTMLMAFFSWYFFGCWLFLRTLNKKVRWALIVLFLITLPMIIPGLYIMPNFIQSTRTW